MNYEKLTILNQEILACSFIYSQQPPCRRVFGFSPIVNELWQTQKYLIISSDPSSGTDKGKKLLEAHSNFEKRLLTLFFTGVDDVDMYNALKPHYSALKEIFLTYFYWTHFSKCFANGTPNAYCAELFLQKEIDFFQPKLILTIGNKATEFLLGPGTLQDRVNRLWKYQDVPVISTLHPSQNWNRFKRKDYFFYETWELIRQTAKLEFADLQKVETILKNI